MTQEKQIIKAGKPKGDTYYQRVAKNYEVKRRKQDWWHVEQEQMQELLATLPNGLSVVDIPFGTGRFVPLYREKGFKIAGLDASSDMIGTAKDILGEAFEGVDARVGDAADLPFKDGAFDLLVSTRFLRDIVTFRHAKAILQEFSRVTSQYAIIQLGHNRKGGFVPDEDVPMGGWLSESDTLALLKDHGFEVLQKRPVLKRDDDGTDVFHFLCQKI